CSSASSVASWAGRAPAATNPRRMPPSPRARGRLSGVTPGSTPRSLSGRSGWRSRPVGWSRRAPRARAPATGPRAPGKRSRPAWPRCATRSSPPRGKRAPGPSTGRSAAGSRRSGRSARLP
ncbi:MAG: hypothetical protein AVDCRST_MAG05-4273, partial [uncultured Rubrobacteraceae bacterium]